MIRVILEDKDFLIVEKPEGIPTQPLSRDPGSETVASLLAEQYPEIKSVGGADWGAVHRLDRETSGLVLFARNQETYDVLREAFSKNQVKKEYVALVQGRVMKSGRIDDPIGNDPKSPRRVKVYRNTADARRNKAQEAYTLYKPIGADLIHVPSTLLHVTIKTGRRHQIRVHLAAAGHPIVGDSLYGGPPADRLYLHADRLRFRCSPRLPSHRREAERWVEAVSLAPFGEASV